MYPLNRAGGGLWSRERGKDTETGGPPRGGGLWGPDGCGRRGHSSKLPREQRWRGRNTCGNQTGSPGGNGWDLARRVAGVEQQQAGSLKTSCSLGFQAVDRSRLWHHWAHRVLEGGLGGGLLPHWMETGRKNTVYLEEPLPPVHCVTPSRSPCFLEPWFLNA